jgi:hypothetical protein
MNPFIIDDSRECHQDRLNEAAEWRQARRARANRVSRVDRLRVGIGDWLIAVGQYLKATRRQAPQCDWTPPATLHTRGLGSQGYGTCGNLCEGIGIQ